MRTYRTKTLLNQEKKRLYEKLKKAILNFPQKQHVSKKHGNYVFVALPEYKCVVLDTWNNQIKVLWLDDFLESTEYVFHHRTVQFLGSRRWYAPCIKYIDMLELLESIERTGLETF